MSSLAHSRHKSGQSDPFRCVIQDLLSIANEVTAGSSGEGSWLAFHASQHDAADKDSLEEEEEDDGWQRDQGRSRHHELEALLILANEALQAKHERFLVFVIEVNQRRQEIVPVR